MLSSSFQSVLRSELSNFSLTSAGFGMSGGNIQSQAHIGTTIVARVTEYIHKAHIYCLVPTQGLDILPTGVKVCVQKN